MTTPFLPAENQPPALNFLFVPIIVSAEDKVHTRAQFDDKMEGTETNGAARIPILGRIHPPRRGSPIRVTRAGRPTTRQIKKYTGNEK